MNEVEREVKFEVKNFPPLIKQLKKMNSIFVGQAFQRTIRLDTPNMDLEKEGKFLRVRSGFENALTLKIKRPNNRIYEREEIEFKIGNVENARKIFNSIGFSKEKIMEKRRSNWKLLNSVISLDELPFGKFIEIEGEEDEIFEISNKLGFDFSKRIIVTYWDLFDTFKKNNPSLKLGDSILFKN